LAGWTPLHHLLRHFSSSKPKCEFSELLACVNCLLKKGCDVNLSTKRKTTALHIAAQTKLDDAELMKSLLVGGALPNVYDDEGISPLILATEHNMPKVVRVLLEYDASPCNTNRYVNENNVCKYEL
jgi:ankyrin repeat protein